MSAYRPPTPSASYRPFVRHCLLLAACWERALPCPSPFQHQHQTRRRQSRARSVSFIRSTPHSSTLTAPLHHAPRRRTCPVAMLKFGLGLGLRILTAAAAAAAAACLGCRTALSLLGRAAQASLHGVDARTAAPTVIRTMVGRPARLSHTHLRALLACKLCAPGTRAATTLDQCAPQEPRPRSANASWAHHLSRHMLSLCSPPVMRLPILCS